MLAISVASLVCFLFYLNRPLIDRNYGGVSVCFRWLLWFAPLWLLVVTPVMAWFETTPMRRGTLLHIACIKRFFDVSFDGKSLAIAVDLPLLAVFGLAGFLKTQLISGCDVMERSQQLNALRFGFEWHQGCADFR